MEKKTTVFFTLNVIIVLNLIRLKKKKKDFSRIFQSLPQEHYYSIWFGLSSQNTIKLPKIIQI